MNRYLHHLRLILLSVLWTACTQTQPKNEVTLLDENPSADQDRFFFSQVKPILDRRCVSCHSCYTAPCQLNLAHIEGIRRGASKIPLYDGTRLKAVAPTRLFVDAHSALEWFENKQFFPIAQRPSNQLSILESLVTQRLAIKSPIRIPVDRARTCPANQQELLAYQKKFPEGGMPYGFPPLQAQEIRILSAWLDAGYPKLTADRKRQMSEPPLGKSSALSRWEALWNNPDPRHRLVARYIYEHIYLAHLRLPELPGEFYRLVRSRTPPPQTIDVIATVRPFDSPGSQDFYYRLQKIEETLTLKNHIIYPLNSDKWLRWQQLFFQEPWPFETTDMPSYAPQVAANPFLTFRAIPAEARYRFLLDDAQYFVSSFIKGPVCEGQTAVNVIDEHFLIFFLNPRQDLAQQNPGFLDRAASDLALPAQGRNDPLSSFYVKFKAAQLSFVEQRQRMFAASFPNGLELNDIWDGDGHNPQAVLTVFRHFDYASVHTGALGSTPKTSWVMDYPIFERMYYLLVAGFDVFGNVFHQASTRMYMDNLRVESEDLFLSFFDRNFRQKLRKTWYRGLAAQELMKYLNPYGGVQNSSRIPYYTKDPKREFLQYVLDQKINDKVRGQTDSINCCLSAMQSSLTASEKILSKLSQKQGAHLTLLPDLSLLQLYGTNGKVRLYSLIHHKEHSNVSFMFGEDGRRLPQEDRLDILPGIYGAFPNFFLSLRETQLEEFVRDTLNLKEKDTKRYKAWKERYGMTRQNPQFWKSFDQFQNLVDQQLGDASGILDLSKYEL